VIIRGRIAIDGLRIDCNMGNQGLAPSPPAQNVAEPSTMLGYSWNENWTLFSPQRLAVRILLCRWERAMLPYLREPDKHREAAYAVTAKAVDEIHRVLEHEQDVFFGAMKGPEDILKQPSENGARTAQGVDTTMTAQQPAA
jgi:hypothetical protein